MWNSGLFGFLLFLFFCELSWAKPDTGLFKQVENSHLLWWSEDLKSSKVRAADVLKAWALRRVNDSSPPTENLVKMLIPVQSGRAALAFEGLGRAGDILVKGSGLNPERVSEVGKIRYDHITGKVKPMDGAFLIREALLDQMTSEILSSHGVRVAKPLAIIGFENSGESDEALKGVYVREFLNQTRLSNLDLLSDEDLKAEFERSSRALQRANQTDEPMNFEEHYFYLLDEMAKMVATFHYLGFEHRFFYAQQVTLAGEITDLGTGSWLYDDSKFSNLNSNVEIPYLSFSNQILLGLNMFIRTHALKTESPERLNHDSATLLDQKKTLLSAIRRIDSDSAERIESQNSEMRFWRAFARHLNHLHEREVPSVHLRKHLSENLEEYVQKRRADLSESQLKQLMMHQEDFEILKQKLGLRFLPDKSLLQLIDNLPDHWRHDTPGFSFSSCISSLQKISSLAQ